MRWRRRRVSPDGDRGPALRCLDEATDIPRAEDSVGPRHEARRPGTRRESAGDHVGRSVSPGLVGVTHLEAPGAAVACERSDLLGEVPRDDDRPLDACQRELAQERPEHGSSVDRQDRLRPTLGDGAKPASLARGHDDRMHEESLVERGSLPGCDGWYEAASPSAVRQLSARFAKLSLGQAERANRDEPADALPGREPSPQSTLEAAKLAPRAAVTAWTNGSTSSPTSRSTTSPNSAGVALSGTAIFWSARYSPSSRRHAAATLRGSLVRNRARRSASFRSAMLAASASATRASRRRRLSSL